MSRTKARYAPSVLQVTEGGIVTGGWLQQIQQNRRVHYEQALDLHRSNGGLTTAYLDLAARVNSNQYFEDCIASAATAILLSPSNQVRESTDPNFEFETAPFRYAKDDLSLNIKLMRGVYIREGVRKRGILRRRRTGEIATKFALQTTFLDAQQAEIESALYDSSTMPDPLDFGRILEPYVYDARPRLWGSVVCIDDREILQVQPPSIS